jgi:hypothetical protein
MKKVLLSVALALAVAGSWAFYPKAPAEPTGYMMVVGKSFGNDITMTVITSDGQYTETGVPVTKLKYRSEDLHKAVLLQLNQLRQSGWRVVNTAAITTSGGNGGSVSYETTYLLDRP